MSYSDDILKVANISFPWSLLSGCNLLVTGATGLIGSCLIEVLLSNPVLDYDVYAAGRNEARARERFGRFFDNPHFHFLKYDVVLPFKSTLEFHYVIHAASNASPASFVSSPVETMKANLLGVMHLLDYGKDHLLKRFLYVSSGEVYGEGDGREFSEEYSGYVDCTSPRSCYPSSKRASETLCVAYGKEYGLDTVIARPCHTYGPWFTETDSRVYAQFIRNVLSGEDIVMKSSGSQFRSWCYVVDCVSALLHILFYGQRGNAYNIADKNSSISIKELAIMIAGIANKKVVIQAPELEESSGYNVVKKSVFSTKKIEGLGWTVEGSMRDKMLSTIQARQCV